MTLEQFLMVDAVRSLDREAGRISACSTVPTASPVFEGHFPGFAVVPGVLLIETMAQVSGHLAMALLDFEKMVFLASVRSARFKRFVEPGDAVEVDAELVQQGSGYSVMKARLSLPRLGEGRAALAASAELRFSVADFPNPTMRQAILGEAERARATGAER